MSDAASQQPISVQDSAETSSPRAPASPAADSSSDPSAATRPSRGGPSRGRAILVLTTLALLPAALGGRIFGGWDRVPPPAQWAIIGIGLVCTIAVVYLVLNSESDEGS